MKHKIVLIGCGNVGMSFAYALLNQQTSVNELVLIDVNEERIIGEAMDLNHCLSLAPNKIDIHVGTYQDCENANIVVIAAGANQNPGETRMDLIDKNSTIFKSIVTRVMESGFQGIFLVATNPLDVMTYLTWKYSNLPTHQVIGSGTSLDTARLRYLIGDRLNITPKNIHAYVIGEHGDSEFIPWSKANIGFQSMQDYLTEIEMEQLHTEVKDAAYEIINRKGATYYGIGMCLVRIINAILGDENAIITVSTYDSENDIFIGLPAIINHQGVREVIPMDLTLQEKEFYQNSVNAIQNAIDHIKQKDLFLK